MKDVSYHDYFRRDTDRLQHKSSDDPSSSVRLLIRIQVVAER